MTDHEHHPHVAVAKRLVDRLIAGDVAGVGEVYAEDVVVFRNFDGRELPRAKVLKVVGFLAANVRELRYDDLRITPTPKGFVQQHVLRGLAPNGAELAAHACLVAEVVDGRIRRIDEYIDSAQMAPLMGG